MKARRTRVREMNVKRTRAMIDKRRIAGIDTDNPNKIALRIDQEETVEKEDIVRIEKEAGREEIVEKDEMETETEEVRNAKNRSKSERKSKRKSNSEKRSLMQRE